MSLCYRGVVLEPAIFRFSLSCPGPVDGRPFSTSPFWGWRGLRLLFQLTSNRPTVITFTSTSVQAASLSFAAVNALSASRGRKGTLHRKDSKGPFLFFSCLLRHECAGEAGVAMGLVSTAGRGGRRVPLGQHPGRVGR